jgi:O-antigen/teichoic acid export membrane protein
MIRTLLLNTGSNVLVMLVKLAITFIMTPVFVRNLGYHDFGLWEIVVSVIGYMGMLDMGIRPAISRFSAKYNAEGDRENLLTVFASTFVFMAFIGILLMTFFSLWGFWYADVLAPDGESAHRYTLWLIIIGIRLLFVFPGYVAESYLEGFQKYYLKNNLTIVISVIIASVVYSLITPENGLLVLAAGNAIGLSVKYILFFIILARPAFGGISLRLRSFSPAKLKEIIVFGSKSFVQGAANRIETSTDVLIIGYFLGPAIVPFYSIPANLAGYLRMFGWNLTHVFMPLFSDLSAKSEDRRILEVYLGASKYIVGLTFSIATGVVLLGGPFLAIWIGQEFREKGEIIIWMMAVFMVFPFINPFASRYLTAVNKHAILAKLAPLSAALNVILSLALVNPFGAAGVAAGSMVSALIFVPVYLRYTCRELGIPVRLYLARCVLPCVPPTLVLAAVVIAVRSIYGIHGYIDIILLAAGAGAVWLAIFWFAALNAVERQYISTRLGRTLSVNHK